MAPVAQQLHGFSPCRIEAGGEIDLDEGRHRSDYDAAVPPSGLRILLVDSTANAELTRTLARAGHDVLEVTDEQQAKRFLGVFQPDLVLLVTAGPGRMLPRSEKSCRRARRKRVHHGRSRLPLSRPRSHRLRGE
jgi:hypothetical protein